ncbi:MAG: substrate-binding domain-containing protein [candidate division KSB1 bacterium]|nr:substrate-binding domain-containing protein [candidate division KSB1 bacterium]MDZ7304111.1 substrate-binding domain-containing protein [candidate division KSB1 bacterium]MDZ7313392.1 substrate-binding domain-containing protein [candidate division KSB1 bacterium]
MQQMRILILAILVISLFITCGKSEKQSGTKTIGVTLFTRAHQFYKDLEEGLVAGAKQHNFNLIIVAGESDLSRQISQIEDFITHKVDAMVVCPVDSKGIGKGITAANAARIPVFTADLAAQEGEVVCHIASDHVAGGRLAGEYLAKLLNGKGQIAIIDQPVVTSVQDRVQGFREIISQYPEIEIVKDVNGDGVRDRAMQVAADVLQAHPNLRAIFAINDDSALGALDAVEDFNRQDVIIIGYDATPEARDAILSDRALKADVVQYPRKIGEQTIEMIARYFRSEPVPPVLPVAVGIVDKKSLQEAN